MALWRVIAEFRKTREKILVAYGGHKESEENLSVFFCCISIRHSKDLFLLANCILKCFVSPGDFR